MDHTQLPKGNSIQKSPIMCRWFASSPAAIKINCDALIDNIKIGIGFVIRNHLKVCLFTVCKVFNNSLNILIAEALAVKETLLFVLQENYGNIIVESYSKLLIDGLANGICPDWRIQATVHDIFDLMSTYNSMVLLAKERAKSEQNPNRSRGDEKPAKHHARFQRREESSRSRRQRLRVVLLHRPRPSSHPVPTPSRSPFSPSLSSFAISDVPNEAFMFSFAEKMGFEIPTQIQAQAIPVVVSGRHVLVNAATGTGKTIVYLAPIVHLLQMYEARVQRSDGTYALVLVPTRELCMQVYAILQKLLHCFHWIVPGYIMGGENRAKEKARLRKGISILIATPGRLLDHLKNTSSFKYTNLRWIVFDEADSILELGFGKAVEEILDLLGSRQMNDICKKGKDTNSVKISRQNLLLSATLNEKVNHLANISLENPVMIGMEHKKDSPMAHELSLGNFTSATLDEDLEDGGGISSQSIENYNLPAQLVQRYVKVSSGSRLVVLLSILRSLFQGQTSQKIVVFFSTCDAVDFHYSLFNEFKWSPNPLPEANQDQKFVSCRSFHLHGNMEHNDRRKAFQGFSSEKSALLLCTDVAARGLDFPKVRCIIQYDSPGEASEYVHRVGRTARLGEKGEALLFLQPVEIDYLHDLQRHGVCLKEYPLQKDLAKFSLYGQKHQKDKLISLETHPWVLFLQKALETFISTEPKLKKLAKDAFCTWVRAYTAHRGELKKIFMVKKLHLGHVARSFGLKEQPSLVGRSHHIEAKKRKRNQMKSRSSKRRKSS
ncbi:DEAD-box ATP-dependent RNA helicase 17 isoform X1 [Canna indica]|uniref:ATP-dependent RNA helicase n=1 Tax=Canna indica TaxID=4628 RepID=A0AAQ3K2K4_9LILI|nr:DEAD-box ATP-dependent RNA helicase 17 isoform X1 [Canna indica]